MGALSNHLCQSPRRVLRARILRIEALTQAGLLGHAASVLASVLKGANLVKVSGGYAGFTNDAFAETPALLPRPPPPSPVVAPDPIEQPNPNANKANQANPPANAAVAPAVPEPSSTPAATAKQFLDGVTDGFASNSTSTTSSGQDPFTQPGLPYYSLAPFSAHLPLTHPTNQLALSWIASDRSDQSASSSPTPTASNNATMPTPAAAADRGKPPAAAASAAAKKGKPDPGAEAAAAAAAEAAAQAAVEEARKKAESGAPPGPRGAHDVDPKVQRYLGPAGHRSLALARAKLLACLASAHGGLGSTPSSPANQQTPAGNKAKMLAMLRGAADSIAKEVSQQCVQRAVVSAREFRRAAGAQAEALDWLASLENAPEANNAPAVALTPTLSSSSVPVAKKSKKAKRAESVAGAEGPSCFELLSGLALRPSLLRCLLEALHFRARLCLLDGKLAEAARLAEDAAMVMHDQANNMIGALPLASRVFAKIAEAEPFRRAAESRCEKLAIETAAALEATLEVMEKAAAEAAANAATAAAAPTKGKGNAQAVAAGPAPGSPEAIEQARMEAASALASAQGAVRSEGEAKEEALRFVLGQLASEESEEMSWEETLRHDEGGASLPFDRWLESRELLAIIALGDGRLEDSLDLVEVGVEEALSRNEVKLKRRLQLIGVKAKTLRGGSLKAETEGNEVLQAMLQDKLRGGAIDLCHAVGLFASFTRERALAARSATEAAQCLRNARRVLAQGAVELNRRLRCCGFIGVGPLTVMSAEPRRAGDGNGSAHVWRFDEDERAITHNITGADMIPPLLQSLLEASANLDSGAIHTAALEGPDALASSSLPLLALRPLPRHAERLADVDDVTAPTPFANLYHSEVPLLSTLLCSMAEIGLDLPLSLQEQLHSLRLATEGLALLRHCAWPSPELRARLLFAIGCLRRRTLDFELEEEHALAAGTAEDEGAPGSALFGLPPAHPTSRIVDCLAGSLRLSASLGGHDHVLMRSACLELVLHLGADRPSVGPQLRQLHLQSAMRYLYWAADLARRERYLNETLPCELKDGPFPLQGLPPALVDELKVAAAIAAPQLPPPPTPTSTSRSSSSSSSNSNSNDNSAMVAVPTVRTAVSLLLSLRRELSSDPWSLSPTARPLIAALHSSLLLACPLYRERAAYAEAERPPIESIPSDTVCLQWRLCDAGYSSSNSNDPHDGSNDARSDNSLRTHAEGFLLLGRCSLLPASEGNVDRLLSIPPVPIHEVATAFCVLSFIHFPLFSLSFPFLRFSALMPILLKTHTLFLNVVRFFQLRALWKRAAAFRHAFHRIAEDGAQLPEAVLQGWASLTEEVQRLLRPPHQQTSSGASVGSLASHESAATSVASQSRAVTAGQATTAVPGKGKGSKATEGALTSGQSAEPKPLKDLPCADPYLRLLDQLLDPKAGILSLDPAFCSWIWSIRGEFLTPVGPVP